MRTAGAPSSSAPSSSSGGTDTGAVRALRVMAEQFANEGRMQQAILCLEAVVGGPASGSLGLREEVEVRAPHSAGLGECCVSFGTLPCPHKPAPCPHRSAPSAFRGCCCRTRTTCS